MKTCNLCKKEKPLIKKSHIIPDFFFKATGLFNEKHQTHKVVVNEFLESKKFSYVPTGDYEGGILCKECDNELIGDLETYGRKVLYGQPTKLEDPTKKVIKNPIDGAEYTIYEKVDYHKFKLFLLSILWRACITTRKVFKEADISEQDKENIRLMLISGNSGEIKEYPIVFMTYLNDSKLPKDLIIQPIKSQTNEEEIITFLICGYVFIFNITKDFKNICDIEDLTITPDNKFKLIHIPENEGWNFILRFANIKK